uniref:Glutamate synthase large subunit n=1 Tax=Rhizobium etli TaxID=29449 RepID=Q9ZFB9_RHIET|nr:glutamate synthase large subunit [Rhizobium etli CFN 42]
MTKTPSMEFDRFAAADTRATANMSKSASGLPKKQGLYDPRNEHDACGVGFVAHMKGEKSHQIVKDGLFILENLTHRGAVGADPLMGDGAGILVQIPDRFFREEMAGQGITLPPAGEYGVGHIFMPRDEKQIEHFKKVIKDVIEEEGQVLIGFRDVPVDNSSLSKAPDIAATEPHHVQVFIGAGEDAENNDEFERRLFTLRKVISNRIYDEFEGEESNFYPVSLSSTTVVYKGMFLAYQVGAYYKDLSDPRFESAVALVHQRFSTNTFPSWKLAHPYRMVAHNGEINTLRGNVNWMAARQASVSSPLFGEDISKLWPISYEGQSDTACFDNALNSWCAAAIAGACRDDADPGGLGRQPVDGGRTQGLLRISCGADGAVGRAGCRCLHRRQADRRDARPQRPQAGALPRHRRRSRHHGVSGRRAAGSSRKDHPEVAPAARQDAADRHGGRPYHLRSRGEVAACDGASLSQLARPHPAHPRRAEAGGAAGAAPRRIVARSASRPLATTTEDTKILMSPMATTGQEAIGSMGTDTPISAMSEKPKLLYTYFKQNFAQVTNPPIDPIREELVMSLVSFIGPRPNILRPLGHGRMPSASKCVSPILTNGRCSKRSASIRAITGRPVSTPRTLRFHLWIFERWRLPGIARNGFDRTSASAPRQAVKGGYNIIVLSDRQDRTRRIAIPGACWLRPPSIIIYPQGGFAPWSGFVVETGEPGEVHHFCLLAGYGAEAINPFLPSTRCYMHAKGEFPKEVDASEVVYRYIKAVGKGILKVMSKMGISTYQSYCGAQIFDAIGLSSELVDKYFFGTATMIEGIGLEAIAEETVARHNAAFGKDPLLATTLDIGGEYAYRMRGESHAWTPDAVAALQHAVRRNAEDRYREFAEMVNNSALRMNTIRGLFKIKSAEALGRKPVSIDEVEPAADIVRRFSTGAMSFGSISREAHTTLAIAMNRIGGKSNTGEGGEESDRYMPLSDGSMNPERSAIKQIASGRFGVTTEYLVNADVLQIKVAQGAKPGEGGQLPGHKVDATVAKTRHSTPGVGLISPPPHHDIYSIEDLAQLIYDLKNVNPTSDVSVKLVSEVGVGTVAAGVAKARADHITVAGFDGGTGASPLTSFKHAGSPWEIGLAETQQTLVLNGLRSRVALQVDGGLKTGRDVIIGALLGADEFGFATAPLIAAGCIMMRKCHLNTCPVGVATQDPVLRKRFKGTPEHVINYFFFVANEVREILASLGFTRLDETHRRFGTPGEGRDAGALEGQGPRLQPHLPQGRCRQGGNLLDEPAAAPDRSHSRPRADRAGAAGADGQDARRLRGYIKNVDRSAGAMLSGEVAKRYRHRGLKEDTINVTLRGTAGQSFGAFLARGVTFNLIGDGNDYVGKGLSGGKIIIRPPENSQIVAEDSIIVGNTVLYGATEGECYFRGVAGERFAVRNSGAIAIVEGVGDHGCEYMTGGVVVVLGATGRNFAAGMSGGVAYVLDEAGDFASRCNMAMVELEPVPEEDDMLEKLHHHGGDLMHKGRVDVSGDMTRHDEERLYQLISNHLHYTGSTRAKQILDHWADYRPKFRKVMPVEYRRALEEMERSRMGIAAE